MNWFACNYMNLVVNVLHTLLILSPSMSTALSNIRQTFLMSLAISTVTLISDWSASVIRVILPCCCDFRIRVECSTKSYACPLCVVFLIKLGLIPFNLELTFTFLSLRSVGTSRTHSLTLCINHTLTTDRVILLASVWHCGQGITLRPTARTPTTNGLRFNWDFLLRRSPWHVGGSSTVNRISWDKPRQNQPGFPETKLP